MTKKVIFVIFLFLLASCATGEKMVRLEPGMTKSQVIDVMGRPDGFKAEGDYEVLRYTNRLISGWSWDRADYNVLLKNGKVVEYGAGEVRAKQSGTSTILFLTPIR